jgi:hypothetical protein
LSGRWFFLDELAFWVTHNYLWQNYASTHRNGADGIIRSDAGANTDRGAAWGLRSLAQLLAVLPATHPIRADIMASWEANADHYYSMVVTGTKEGGEYLNTLGLVPHYGTGKGYSVYTLVNGYPSDSADSWNVAGWMQMMHSVAWGHAWDLALPQSAGSQTKHQAVRDHCYTLPVALAGVGDPNEWNYRWFGPYDLAVGRKSPVGFYANWNEAFDAAVGIFGAPPSANTLYRNYSATAWSDPVYLTSFFGQHAAALAFAVDHGKAGAAAAWARITGASNWAGYTTGFADAPQYGIVPRSTPSTTSYGLEWDGTGPSVRRLQWINPPPIYGSTDGMTYLLRVYPRKKTVPPHPNGYFTTFFWGNNGTFWWNGGNAGTYYGAHPYPTPPPNGPGQWEISVDGGDYVTGSEVQWDRWYTQAFRAWRVSATETRHEFYYDWPDTSKVITTTINSATWAQTNPPSPAIVMGQAPNVGSASWGGYAGYEELNGILRGIQIYDGLLSLADITQEIASPKSSVKGAASIWYLNTDPRPTDVADKKGTGTAHNPTWAGGPANEWVG